jgi:uncharacterized protein YajQ (UPF0234 family)
MASFDITNKIDIQKLDNSINTASREILTRYDFKGSSSTIDFNKKEVVIKLESENEMRIQAMEDVIISRMIKQGCDARSLDRTKEAYPSGKVMRKEIKIKEGIDRETAKKIINEIKESKLKVQTAIMDDLIRVTAKKIDDLQAVISLLRSKDFEVPVQFVNMKS